MTYAFGLVVWTLLSAPADLPKAVSELPPAAEPARLPCDATNDGPVRPTIVGRDGRFDQRCYDPKMELVKAAAQLATGRGSRGTIRLVSGRR